MDVDALDWCQSRGATVRWELRLEVPGDPRGTRVVVVAAEVPNPSESLLVRAIDEVRESEHAEQRRSLMRAV
ncbi:MAG: hypothetical protein JWP14_364 [Frankiales bacterium]|nr:hypothetical protein [Frankiales bacterium]